MTKVKLAKMMELEFETLYLEDTINRALEKADLPNHPAIIHKMLDIALECEFEDVEYNYIRIAKIVKKQIKKEFKSYIKELK